MQLWTVQSARAEARGERERPARRLLAIAPIAAAAAVVVSSTVAVAQSPPTTYTTRAAWAAAAGAVNTITFDGLAPAGSFTAYDNSTGLPEQGVRFTGYTASTNRYYLRAVDAGYSTGFNWGSGSVLHGPPQVVGPAGEGGTGSSVVAAVPIGTMAVGVDLMSFRQYGSVIAIGVVTVAGNQYSFSVTTLAYPQRAFFGLVSTEPILSLRFIGLTGFPTLDNFSFGGPAALGSPRLTGTTSGSTVSLSWTPAPVSAPASGYLVEAAFSSFGTAAASVPVAGTSLAVAGVPARTYYLRVRAVSAAFPSGGPSSNEVVLNVGGACSAAPLPPAAPTASAQNGVVTFSWLAPASGCTPTGYVVRAGTAPGAGNMGTFDVGLATSISGPVPPATYYLAAFARNGAALSAASGEVSVTVGNTCTAPAAPAGFTATSALDAVTLTWQATAGAVRYLIDVGSTSGGTDIGTVPWTATALQTAGVQRGVYFLRVRAESACGLVGPASGERMLTVSY